jgi:hypothetical protein
MNRTGQLWEWTHPRDGDVAIVLKSQRCPNYRFTNHLMLYLTTTTPYQTWLTETSDYPWECVNCMRRIASG